MRLALAFGTLIALPQASMANQVCDFEHRCFETGSPPGQTYHMDPNDPDRETPPPAPQYSGRDIVVQPNASGCKLFKIRSTPAVEPLIVEICPVPADEEREIRARANGAVNAGEDPSAQ
jgi:hypothetical protein